MKNWLLKWGVKVLQKFIPKHHQRDRFLIVTTTALGDTLWATAAIENLRKTYPGALIGALTSRIGMEVFKHNPHIDRLYLYKKPLKLLKKLYRQGFDTVLLFHASQRVVLPLCNLLGANRIVGTLGINKGLDVFLTDPLPNIPQHEIVRRLKIVQQVGAEISTEKLSFFLSSEEEIPPFKSTTIAIHPGSKDSFKRWPKNRFIALGKKLKEYDPNCQIIITGEEQELAEEIAHQIPGAVVDAKRPLRNFAAFLKRVDLLISNDTGPVHLACALNTPVIGIYSATDPNLCGPHQAKSATAIAKKATCQPCLRRKCREPFCFLQISENEIFEAAKQVLNARRKE